MSGPTSEDIAIIEMIAADMAEAADRATPIADALHGILMGKNNKDACAALSLVLASLALESPNPKLTISAIATISARTAQKAQEILQ